MTTAQDLVDAVRPCLPLPNIDRVTVDYHDDEDRTAFGWVTCAHRDGRLLRPSEVIGAIWQACAERGWAISFNPEDTGWETMIANGEECFSFAGTTAISLCRAYAAAKEASDGT